MGETNPLLSDENLATESSAPSAEEVGESVPISNGNKNRHKTSDDHNIRQAQFDSTVLHEAIAMVEYCRNACFEIIRLLVQNHGNVNAKDEEGRTPLSIAVRAQEEAIVAFFLKAGANVNEKLYDRTPLHDAITDAITVRDEDPCLEIIRLLLKYHANVNAKDEVDRTPLHLAALCPNPDIIRLLVRCHANVNAKDKEGRTPLHVVASCGYFIETFTESVDVLLKAGACINEQASDGKTALHFAISKRRDNTIQLIQTLLNFGAQVNIPDKKVPLACGGQYYSGELQDHWSSGFAISKRRYDTIQIMQTLLNSGAQVNIPDKDGWYPINLAVERNHISAVRKLVEAQSRIDCRITESDQTLVDQAAQSGFYKLVDYLVLHGAPVTSPDSEKSSLSTLLSNDETFSEQHIMDTLDLFIQNGYIIQNDHWFNEFKLPEELTNHKQLQDWLQNCRNSVQSLAGLCRSSIRKRLLLCTGGRSIIKKIQTLPLPSVLIEYIMFKDRLEKNARLFKII